ncbi:MAG: type I-D CRISPR-associated helicase Cas3' [Chloroflexota bacterium]|nr:type I-D CRISPR-associated helicase Cas3' [Chloroflexota bacterium]
MTVFTVKGRAEKLAPANDEYKGQPLLLHQVRTWEALRSFPLVLNTYNTGTGKTRAAHLRLLELDGKGVNVLIIAPTNELIAQHVRDAEEFVAFHRLRFKVLPIRAPDIARLTNTGLRKGETLQRYLNNYREFADEWEPLQPTIMITNPDIFYYALYMRYGEHDVRNVFEAFVSRFDYIIIDEFHYYSSKQVANFLFALTLFDQFGYFSHRDRRICLLSATPRSEITVALNRLFGSQLAFIAPDNEPPGSEHLPRVTALSPLEVSVVTQDLESWVRANRGQIESWIDENAQDGVIISGSLARINTVYSYLRHLGERVLRLTGPEPREARARAVQAQLILATPTVDLGYNFVKQDKRERQNIDFVICEALYRDELLQRIGRAGRVLQKERADIPSRAFVLLSDNAAKGLATLHGQQISREEFAQHLQGIDALPIKHRLDAYLREYALQEAAYPLSRLSSTLPRDLHSEVTAIFERLRDALSPNSKSTLGRWQTHYRHHRNRKLWLNDAHRLPDTAPQGSIEVVGDWLEAEYGERPDNAALHSKLDVLWRRRSAELVKFVESRVTLQDALFSFRDSFGSPNIAFCDPQRWFSSEAVAVYSALHLLANYDLVLLKDRAAFKRVCASAASEELEADFYAELKARRETPARIDFGCETQLDRASFDNRWTKAPVALRDLYLLHDGVVPQAMNTWMRAQWIVCLIIPAQGDLEARVRGRLRHSHLYPRRLTLYCAGDEQPRSHEGYLIFLGTSAFEAHAALKPLLQMSEVQSDSPMFS